MPNLPDPVHPGQTGPSPDFLEALDPATGVERLAQLARSQDWWVRAQVAERPDTPFEVVAWLAHDECPEVAAAVLARLDLPLPILQEVLSHPHTGIRAWAATEPALPPSLQAVAAVDRAVQVRLAVANRAVLAGDVRRVLVRDRARVVRATVLANPATPRWVWRRGVEDPDPGNRLLVLERPDLSPGAALVLAADERLFSLPGAHGLIKVTLQRALQALRPSRRAKLTAQLLVAEARATRALVIEALGSDAHPAP